MTRVRVVGAGLSGLSAAWALARRGIPVEIVEAAPVPGGLIHTIVLPEGPVETGANGFVWAPAVDRLFQSLGIEPMFAREASRRRYIFRNGRPRRWPLTAGETAATLGRFGAAWLRGRIKPRPGESVAAWGDRVVGRAATASLLAPALQGIYGAPAAELSAEAVGIARKRERIRLAAPRDGMGAMITALVDALTRRGATFTFARHATSLEPGVPVMVCTSAAAAAPLLAPHHPPLAGAAARIRSAPLVTATAFFARHADDIRGFGVLFPRGSARALGVLFNTEIFDGRGALRSERWIYGDAALAGAPAREIDAAVQRDREQLTGRRDSPVALHAQGWTAALPIYDEAVAEAAKASATLPPWLGVCGNYLGRIGVSALVERAETEAARVARAIDPGRF
ncbi:MAG TPA: FAD-dependent oxidoreductase [Vicinamibacterales bacterium]|nr:FAD-dependent oxidoreductase [Vicinamibacterales bacterium]